MGLLLTWPAENVDRPRNVVGQPSGWYPTATSHRRPPAVLRPRPLPARDRGRNPYAAYLAALARICGT